MGKPKMKLIRHLAFVLVIILTASGLKGQSPASSANSQNYAACINGYYGCDPHLLTESERVAVADAAQRRKYENCLNGFYGCDSRQLTESERAAVADAAQRRNYENCLNGFYGCGRIASSVRLLGRMERLANQLPEG
jgi:hypothetical protein